MSGITLELVYEEVRDVNRRIATLEHLLIPEEKLSDGELKELDELVREAKTGKAISFSEIKK